MSHTAYRRLKESNVSARYTRAVLGFSVNEGPFLTNLNQNFFFSTFEALVACVGELSNVEERTELRYDTAGVTHHDDNSWTVIDQHALPVIVVGRPGWWFDVQLRNETTRVTRKPDVIRNAQLIASRVAVPYQDARTVQALPNLQRAVSERRLRFHDVPECVIRFRCIETTCFTIVDGTTGLCAGPTLNEIDIVCPEGSTKLPVVVARIGTILGKTPDERAAAVRI